MLILHMLYYLTFFVTIAMRVLFLKACIEKD
jgi:hypothetical protein